MPDTDYKKPVAVEIPKDIRAKLESLRRDRHPNSRAWEPWEDEVLRAYWGRPGYRQGDVARTLGTTETTARARYRELMR